MTNFTFENNKDGFENFLAFSNSLQKEHWIQTIVQLSSREIIYLLGITDCVRARARTLSTNDHKVHTIGLQKREIGSALNGKIERMMVMCSDEVQS